MMKKLLIAASVFVGAMSFASISNAQVTTQSQVDYIMTNTKPVVFTCQKSDGGTYYQYRYYINSERYLSNYEFGTVSCRLYGM